MKSSLKGHSDGNIQIELVISVRKWSAHGVSARKFYVELYVVSVPAGKVQTALSRPRYSTYVEFYVHSFSTSKYFSNWYSTYIEKLRGSRFDDDRSRVVDRSE